MQEREVWAEILDFSVWEANSGPHYSFVKISKRLALCIAFKRGEKNQIHMVYWHHTNIK